jgi:hypothetical protein
MRKWVLFAGLAAGCGRPAPPEPEPAPPPAVPTAPAAGPDADEALFPRLHAADPQVRTAAASELQRRGLTDDQIRLGRQLASPDPADRLRLLLELTDAEAVADVGPWLERLGRDPDPAVRLGAARMAYECKVVYAGWLDRLADADPDPLVRRWGRYWRDKAKGR